MKKFIKIELKDLEKLARFVDARYEEDCEPTGEFEAICPKCFKNTVATEHKKGCVYEIADRMLKLCQEIKMERHHETNRNR